MALMYDHAPRKHHPPHLVDPHTPLHPISRPPTTRHHPMPGDKPITRPNPVLYQPPRSAPPATSLLRLRFSQRHDHLARSRHSSPKSLCPTLPSKPSLPPDTTAPSPLAPADRPAPRRAPPHSDVLLLTLTSSSPAPTTPASPTAPTRSATLSKPTSRPASMPTPPMRHPPRRARGQQCRLLNALGRAGPGTQRRLHRGPRAGRRRDTEAEQLSAADSAAAATTSDEG